VCRRAVGLPDEEHVAAEAFEDALDRNQGAYQRDRHPWLVGDEAVEDITQVRPVAGDGAVADQVGDPTVGSDGSQRTAGYQRQASVVESQADEVGAERGRPILLAVRAPDSLGYAKALGLDLERWMKDDLIDIWIATGYFRLQDWSETVAIAHQHEVQLWAALDDSRIVKRDNRNSLEVYRGRIQNAWNAGVDAVWLFNFFYGRDDPQFQLLKEAGDPDSLARTSKVYVAEGRGFGGAGHFLKNGERFFTRPL